MNPSLMPVDETQLWLMSDPPMPIHADVLNLRRGYDEYGRADAIWQCNLEAWQPEAIQQLRDFEAGWNLAITHCPIRAYRGKFGGSKIVARFNNCLPVSAEMQELTSTLSDYGRWVYRLVISCKVELLPGPTK